MTVATGPFTVRPWLHGHPGAVVQQGPTQVLSTSSDEASSSLAYGVAMTMSAVARQALGTALLETVAPQNIDPPVVHLNSTQAQPDDPGRPVS